MVGKPPYHAGDVDLQQSLREALLGRQREMMHWLACRECDPDYQASTLLMVVGWTHDDFLREVLSRD